MKHKDKAMCSGCRNDWYNTEGLDISGMGKRSGCWSFEDAEVVTRYKLAWDLPTIARNCHRLLARIEEEVAA